VTAVLNYRGFAVEPKRDFGSVGFYIGGRFIKEGFVVVKGGSNVMPGATWFRTIESAKHAIDVFIDVDGDAHKFWTRLRGEA
jgi:hypothetical protein